MGICGRFGAEQGGDTGPDIACNFPFGPAACPESGADILVNVLRRKTAFKKLLIYAHFRPPFSG
jgi:hypothetical protein